MGDILKFKKQICETGKRLYDKGFASGLSGNISVRFDKGLLITPSGFNLGDVTPDEIGYIDFSGNHIEKGLKPSSEKSMHIDIYKKRPDLNAIIHAHTPKSTAFASAGIALDKPIHSEAYFVLGKVPVIDYAMPSSEELAIGVSEGFSEHDALLMANHGVIVGDKELKHAYYKLETLELYAELLLWSKILGSTKELSQEHLTAIENLRKNF